MAKLLPHHAYIVNLQFTHGCVTLAAADSLEKAQALPQWANGAIQENKKKPQTLITHFIGDDKLYPSLSNSKLYEMHLKLNGKSQTFFSR